MIKILVVCSRNKKRSLTAEKIYANDQRVFVRSAGTSPSAKRKIVEADIKWADVVLCMEDKHLHIIKKQFQIEVLPKCVVLDIEDEYEFMDDNLVEMLQREIERVINK